MDWFNNTINGLIINYIYDKMIHNFSLNKAVKDTVNDILKIDRNNTEINYNVIFGKNSIEELCEQLSKSSVVDLEDIVRSHILYKSKGINLSQLEVEGLTNQFLSALLDAIKINNYELWNNLKIQSQFEKFAEDQDYVKVCLNKIVSMQFPVNICSITEIEDRLKENSICALTLDFYDFEDTNVENIIKEQLKSQKIVNVRGESREEILYYILKVLKDDANYLVYVVDSASTWDWLYKNSKDYYPLNAVFIPNFVDEEILPLINYKTIFIYNEDCIDKNNQLVTVPNRLYNNLWNKLSLFIEDKGEINRILIETNCVYAALKRRLFKSFFDVPQWFNLPVDLLMPAILLCRWEDRSGDKHLIEIFSEKNYIDYINELHEKTFGNTKFYVSFKRWGRTEFRIVDVPYAWQFYAMKANDNWLNKLENYIVEVYLSNQAVSQAEVLGTDNEEYSKSLKKGVAKSLVYLSLTNENSYRLAENLITLLLKNVKHKVDLLHLCEYLNDLFEACPVVVIEQIEKDVFNETSFVKQLFEERNNELLGGEAYVYLLDVINKGLLFDETRLSCLKILEELASMKISYRYVNTPINILSNALAPYSNNSLFTLEEKLNIIDNMIKSHSDVAFDILKKNLPIEQGFLGMVMLPTLRYRTLLKEYNKKDSWQISKEDYFEHINNYFLRFISLCGNDLNKWQALFCFCSFYKYDIKEQVFERLSTILADISVEDKEKYNFSMVIRRFIYEKRKFDKQYTANNELELILKTLLKKIKYNNSVFEYLYVFCEGVVYEIDFTPNAEKHEINDDFMMSIENKRSNQIAIFEKIAKLTDISAKDILLYADPNSGAGYTYAYVFFNGTIDVSLLEELLSIKKKAFVSEYCWYLYKNGNMKLMIECIKKHPENQELAETMLSSLELNDELYNIIIEDKTKLLNMYWKCDNISLQNLSDKYFNSAIENMLKYNNISRVLINIMYSQHEVKIDSIISLLYKIMNNQEGISQYQIVGMFKKIYAHESLNKEQINKVISLEVFYGKVFRDEYYDNLLPKYTLKELNSNPDSYWYFLRHTYRKDSSNNNDITDDEKKMAKLCWDFLYNVKYYPGLGDDTFAKEQLKQWYSEFVKLSEKYDRKVIGKVYLGRTLALLFIAKTKENSIDMVLYDIIEKYYCKDLEDAFINEVINLRGVHTATHGLEEKSIADGYQTIICSLNYRYVKTKKIFRLLANYYLDSSKEIRKRDCYEW